MARVLNIMRQKPKLLPGYKQCSKCRKVLEIDEFYACSHASDGKASACRFCCIERGLRYYRKHRRHCIETVQAYQRRKALEKQFA